MKSEITALAVGRLVPVKNFDVILRAWKDISVPLKIVGDGPLRGQLMQKTQDLELTQKVQFLGERSDVTDLMRASQLLVSASSREGFAYVVLEALQAEMVVISTNTGVASDLLPSRFLIDDPDPDLLQRAVDDVLASFDEVKEKLQSVWTQAKDLTIERMVRETESVYAQTMRDSSVS